MSELPAWPERLAIPQAPAAPVDVTGLARPLGLLVPVAFAPALWAFCEAGVPGAAARLDAPRVARYLLTGLVRALRRSPEPVPAALTWRMALGERELTLAARLEPTGIFVTGGR